MRDSGEDLDETQLNLLEATQPVLLVFNLKEFEDKFDSENAQVIIPCEVIKEQDNDWILDE